MPRWRAFFIIVAILGHARAQSLPAANEILKRVEARLEQISGDATNQYHYTRTNILEELDSSGKVKKRIEKTYLVRLQNGLPEARVVAMNGRALPESEQRRRTSDEQRLQRALAQEKAIDSSKPKPWLNDEITDRFQFKVTGRTNLAERTFLLLTFTPRPDAPAKTIVDRVINKISGALWVDEQEAEIALLNIRLDESMRFWGGVLGELDRFDFTMRRERSPLGAWFNQSTTGYIQIRKLWNTSRFRFQEEAFDFAAGQPPS